MKVCYPGTFDPVTKGHMDIIRRAAETFGEVVVLIMRNPRKKCLFSEQERKAMLERCFEAEGLENVTVEIGTGLTVKYTESLGAKGIIRGIRAISDYEYELQQATANMMISDRVETILLIAKPEYSFLSSSVVKEIIVNGGDASAMMPDAIVEEVTAKLTGADTI